MKLDLGSGYIKREGFISVDIDKKVNPDIKADIRTLKPIKSNSVDEIHISHTLEHILNRDLFKTLRNIHRVLKQKGLVTIVVPDVEQASKDWITKKIDYRTFELVFLGANPTATKYMIHKNIFCEKKLRRYLQITGFTNIHILHRNHHYDLVATAIKPKEKKHA